MNASESSSHNNSNLENGWDELMGKDLMMKSLKIPDPTSSSVQVQDVVLVDFEGWYANEPDSNSVVNESLKNIFQVGSDWLIVVGEKDVVPVLEMGIRFMQEGQTCLLWSHSKFAFGLSTRKHNNYILPANSNVMYKVTLKKIIVGDELESANFKLRLCESKKNIANDIFNNELSEFNTHSKGRALTLYKRSVEMLEYMIQQATKDGAGSVQQNESDQLSDISSSAYFGFNTPLARALLVDCLNNIAAVHLVCKNYHAAKEAAVDVLTRDPRNLKGLIRAAKASLLDPASTFEEVEAAIKAAEESTSKNDSKSASELGRLRKDLQQKKQQYKQRQREMSAKIAKGLRKTDTDTNDSGNVTVSSEDKRNSKLATTNTNGSNLSPTTRLGKAVRFLGSSSFLKSSFYLYGFQLLLTFVFYLYLKRSGRQSQDEDSEL